MKNKMRIIKRPVLITGLLLVSSCGKPTPPYNRISDKDLTIEVMRIKDKEKQSTSLAYDARLTPHKSMMDSRTEKERTALNYNMDSCFYIKNGNKKIYAAIVQSVANGVTGSYEYLIDFNTEEIEQRDSVQLIYQDRYFNRKTYQLKLARK